MASTTTESNTVTFQNFHQVCRLCLSQESLEDIFKKEEHQRWISDYLSIVVSQTDSISQLICVGCRTLLGNFHDFQLRCREVQDILQSNPFAEKQGVRLECDVCAKVFQDKRQLRDHLRTHGVKKHQCTVCGKGFLQPYRLLRHMKTHNKDGNNTKTVHDQSEDDVKNEPEDDLETTANNEEEADDGLTMDCGLCDKKFKSKRQLRDHRRYVHGPKDHKCSVCGKGFVLRRDLQKHADTHMESNSTKEVEDPSELETADSETKSTKKPCPVCKRLIKTESMDGHLNRHKGIQPYKCELGCLEENFYCQQRRKKHHQDVHGWKAYECNICHQSFPTDRSCRLHKLKVHSQWHECQECFLIFECSAAFKKHLAKTNHKQKNSVDQLMTGEDEALENTESEAGFESKIETMDVKVERLSDDDEEMSDRE